MATPFYERTQCSGAEAFVQRSKLVKGEAKAFTPEPWQDARPQVTHFLELKG